MKISWVLKKINRALAPEIITYDPKRNCYTAYFHILDKATDRCMFRGMDGENVKCLEWDGSRFSKEINVAVSDVDPETIHIFHWYKRIDLRTYGLRPFIFNELIFRAFWQNIKEIFLQNKYNRNFRLRQERQDILRELSEKSISFSKQYNRINPFSANRSALEWFFEIHGERAAQHPKYNENSLRFKALLQSLVASNDLKVEDHKISVAPQSFVSLANFELEERRHQDQLSTNRRIVLPTAVLVLIAAVQAAIELASS